MGTGDADQLSREWVRNEAEIQRLKDLPVGEADPAAQERAIDERQDRIEFEQGVEWMARQRGN